MLTDFMGVVRLSYGCLTESERTFDKKQADLIRNRQFVIGNRHFTFPYHSVRWLHTQLWSHTCFAFAASQRLVQLPFLDLLHARM